MAYTDKNLYAYCDNNPVMRVDNGGEFWDTVFDVISLCASVVDVVKNPDDPWAWVGLAADVVSLAVPFATGGGLIVDAVTKADDVVDLAKNVDKVSDATDTVYDGITTMSKVDIPDCFVAGTDISTEDGNKSIEDIAIGDYVWATNPETGETALKKVVDTFVNETNHVTHITINGEIITSTQTHPYYVANKGWILAKNLRAGDILVTIHGERVILELVQHEILEAPVTTYNFEVADFHTYYVGTYNVLVHNKCKVQISQKLEYVFGNATGSKHNIDRSQGLLDQVQSIGINDTPKGRQYMLEQIMEIPDTVSELATRNKYSSLLFGPSGIRQMDTIWENGKLITIYIYGGMR